MGAANNSAIGTLVERASRYLILLHLPHDHTALTVQEAMCAQMARLPEMLRQTLTWDRGSEMTNHAQIAEATGLDIYFADPGPLGSAVPTRTPTDCYVSTSPKAPTCRCGDPESSNKSPAR